MKSISTELSIERCVAGVELKVGTAFYKVLWSYVDLRLVCGQLRGKVGECMIAYDSVLVQLGEVFAFTK